MFDYNEKFNYFEDETLAKDWFNRTCDGIAWKAFEHQEDWVYMVGELGVDENGKPRNPMIKPEVFEVFDQLFEEQIAWMKSNIIMNFIKLYGEYDIDYSPEVEEVVKEHFEED